MISNRENRREFLKTVGAGAAITGVLATEQSRLANAAGTVSQGFYVPTTVSAEAQAPPEDQKHPYVSPVYGDYSKGFPPTLIQAGTKETFLSNAIRHYQVLDQAGIPVKLDLYEGMWHVFQAFPWWLPESRLARQKVGRFLDQNLMP